MAEELSHVGEQGRARMVDVSDKTVTAREAVARARVRMQPETLERIREGGIAKGDVLAVAQVAGIQAAKKTSELIPMCHPLQITGVDLVFEYGEDGQTVEVVATVRCTDRTGVEMEAMTAAAVAGLTIYDMCKAIDRGMTVESVELVKKSGGKSGTYVKEE